MQPRLLLYRNFYTAIDRRVQFSFSTTEGFHWQVETWSQAIILDHNTKIGYNTLCIFYPNKGLGFVIIVNDTTSQQNVGKIENTIKKVLDSE